MDIPHCIFPSANVCVAAKWVTNVDEFLNRVDLVHLHEYWSNCGVAMMPNQYVEHGLARARTKRTIDYFWWGHFDEMLLEVANDAQFETMWAGLRQLKHCLWVMRKPRPASRFNPRNWAHLYSWWGWLQEMHVSFPLGKPVLPCKLLLIIELAVLLSAEKPPKCHRK